MQRMQTSFQLFESTARCYTEFKFTREIPNESKHEYTGS